MHTEEFQASVDRLATLILETVEGFFDDQQFDREAMIQFASQDLTQLATDAHMFGAGLYVMA